MRSILLLPPLALLLGVGCAPERVETPTDLEGLVAFFFTNALEADDVALDEALATASGIVEELAGDGTARVGSLPTLEPEDLTVVGMEDNDPSKAPGFFIANIIECDFDTFGELSTTTRQPELHPGIYDDYDRQHVDDHEAWVSKDIDVLGWETTYSATPTASQYVADTASWIRRVPQGETAPGPGYVLRTILREPADFPEVDDDSHEFSQDYQVDVAIDAGDGPLLHLLGIWRFMKLGIVSSNDDVFIDIQLDGMIQWDDQTEEACATWPELPSE